MRGNTVLALIVGAGAGAAAMYFIPGLLGGGTTEQAAAAPSAGQAMNGLGFNWDAYYRRMATIERMDKNHPKYDAQEHVNRYFLRHPAAYHQGQGETAQPWQGGSSSYYNPAFAEAVDSGRYAEYMQGNYAA